MQRFDVVVIGGGPAGAMAALLLARAGRSVAVVEKAAFPRRKVCGEFVAAPAAALLRALGTELGPRVRRVAVWAGERSLQAPLPAPHAATLAREHLDSFLLQRAREFGATVFQPLKALALVRSKEDLVCETTSLTFAARAVVAAHGSWEPGGLPTQARREAPRPSDLLAFKAHLRGAALPADTIALVPFPGGYGGLLMLGERRATFACCVRRDALEALRRRGVCAGESVLEQARAASAGLRAALAGAQCDGAWLAAGPLRPGARPLFRDGVFAVGNAAGEVHPLVGSGIAMALRSANLLSPLLNGALGEKSSSAFAEAARAYELQWRREFARRLWWSTWFARLAARPAPAARLVARAPWLLTLAARVSAP